MKKRTQFPSIRWSLVALLVLLLPVPLTQAAAALNYGQSAAGSLNAGEQAQYSFTASAGDKPVITMNAHGGSMVPYIALYDPQGQLIGEDSGSGPKGNGLLKGLVLAANGVYQITAVNKASGGSGTYNLRVDEESHEFTFDGGPANSTGVQAYQLAQPWDHTNVTYTIANTLRQFNEQDVDTVLGQALDSWSNGTPLTFTQVQGRGDINLQFAPIDGPMNILGETCPPYDQCDSGSVTLDDSENWVLYQPQYQDDISLLAVASHEFGHAIGLLHTDDANALMYPEYSPYILQPQADDLAGAQRLYGPGNGAVSNPPPVAGLPPPSNNNGQMQVSGQLDDQHFVHYWDFDVVAGDTVTITMSTASGDLDSFLVLLDANNNVLAYDDDSAGDRNATLAHLSFPQAGTYTVAATRYAQAQGYTTGAYTLAIQYDVGPASSAPTTVFGGGNNPPGSTTPQGSGGANVGGVNVSAGQPGSQLPSLDTTLDTQFASSASPGKQARNGRVSAGQSYNWEEVWCATDAQTLADNLANMTVKFNVNGQDVDPSLITQADASNNQYQCKSFSVTLSNWTPGSATLTATLTANQPVFDGEAIYPAGDYVYEYDIQAS